MIIKTRYRDIPFDEVTKCFHPGSIESLRNEWEKWRGREIQIEIPAVKEKQWKFFCCDGPHYAVITYTCRSAGCCPHIAEIGD